MPTELGFYRHRNLIFFQREGDLGEFGHHLLAPKETQSAAPRRRRPHRNSPRGRRKVCARLQFLDNFVSFVLGGDEDMTDVKFFGPGKVFHELLVALLQQFLVEIVPDNFARIVIVSKTHGIEVDPRSDSRILSQPGFDALGGQQFNIDQLVANQGK